MLRSPSPGIACRYSSLGQVLSQRPIPGATPGPENVLSQKTGITKKKNANASDPATSQIASLRDSMKSGRRAPVVLRAAADSAGPDELPAAILSPLLKTHTSPKSLPSCAAMREDRRSARTYPTWG